MSLDVDALLRRGGLMTDAEVEQLARELTFAKLEQMAFGTTSRTLDQPVKVMPLTDHAPKTVAGYFTQQKYVWGKTPEEMESLLGIFGKLRYGAFVLQFDRPLVENDYENKAYSYLPDGKEYVPNPNEKTYLPGKGVPQWRLSRAVDATCIAKVQPNQPFNKASLLL
jgi:hypothetical protein